MWLRHTRTTSFILLHNWASQEHLNLSGWLFGAQLNTFWTVGTPAIIIILPIIQNVTAQHGRLILNRLHPLVETPTIGRIFKMSGPSRLPLRPGPPPLKYYTGNVANTMYIWVPMYVNVVFFVHRSWIICFHFFTHYHFNFQTQKPRRPTCVCDICSSHCHCSDYRSQGC